MFAFGLPHDGVTWAAILLGCLVLAPWPLHVRHVLKRRWLVLGFLCAAAGGLSFAYFKYYLGGAPRLIDATTYLLQARSLAQGSFGMTVVGPSASFRGRFIVSTQDNPEIVAGIFPPGYPALLSLGVRLGHYEYIGPLLGALLVIATYYLALLMFKRVSVALLAAVLSLMCAALRYHTADTMSHGCSALFTVCAMICCVQLTQTPKRLRGWVALGVSLGVLSCTRQFTGLLVASACAVALFPQAKTPWFWQRALPAVVLSAAPALLFLLLQHRAITGSFFETPQHYYYARADGPPGCFQLGWGSGCQYEHRDAVEMQGGHGLSPLWSVLNTLHRLHWHSMDVANFEPLLAFGLLSLWAARKLSQARALLACLCIVPVGYSLFYFNGSYPGGGARFYSELIPLWHALMARGMVQRGAGRWGVAAALFGYGVHANFSHQQLRSPHFGPPPSLLQGALPNHDGEQSLVFVSTAHHFNLLAQASPSVTVARNTHDARLGLVEQQWLAEMQRPGEQLRGGQAPAARIYQFDAEHGLVPLQSSSGTTLRFESESDYPITALSGVWVYPEALPDACVSMGKALRVVRTGGPAHVQFELLGSSKPDPTSPPVTYDVFVTWVNAAAGTSPEPCQRAWVARLVDPKTVLLDLTPWSAATHVDAIELVPHTP